MFTLEDIEAEVQKQNSLLPFSGVIELRKSNRPIYKRAFGMANRSDSIPNNIATRFAIASGCKIFTAVAICQLIEKGVIAFDSRLKDCLDLEFPNFDPDVRVYHLLTHSSGIPDYFNEENDDDYEALWKDRPMYNLRAPGDFLPMFQNGSMRFKPGTRFGYSDSGYIILGLIIEQNSGLQFKDYIQENIFNPAGMTDSGYFATDRLPERTAYSYIEDDDGNWRTNFFAVPIIGAPDGGAFTTVDDLAKFWLAFHDGILLGKEMVAKIIFPHLDATIEGENHYYGLGVWLILSNGFVNSYYVTGWDPGVAMISEFFPQHEILLTILGNSNKPTFPIYRAVREALKV